MNFISNFFKKVFGAKKAPEIQQPVVKTLEVKPKISKDDVIVPGFHRHNNRKNTPGRRIQYIHTTNGEIRTIFHSL